jgi:hypothetical protein
MSEVDLFNFQEVSEVLEAAYTDLPRIAAEERNYNNAYRLYLGCGFLVVWRNEPDHLNQLSMKELVRVVAQIREFFKDAVIKENESWQNIEIDRWVKRADEWLKTLEIIFSNEPIRSRQLQLSEVYSGRPIGTMSSAEVAGVSRRHEKEIFL